jgi:NAD(P)-dependent dehydrogenase (short-subunit alcohol dehydrogenase family)
MNQHTKTGSDAWALAGRRVAITGAASGLGRAMADHFAAAGAHVMGMDVAGSSTATRTEAGWLLLGGDVFDEAAIDRFFSSVESELGGVDAVIGNAGVRGPVGPVEHLELPAWQQVLDVNLTGAFLTARRATPLLRDADAGRLVLISSAAGRLAYPERGAYAASKWGVVGLTQTLARELGPDGVRVNAVLPGLVRSPGAQDMLERRAAAEGLPLPELEQRFLAGTALGEWIEVEDIVNAVRFLCSDAGTHVSGQSISVCGFVERL